MFLRFAIWNVGFSRTGCRLFPRYCTGHSGRSGQDDSNKDLNLDVHRMSLPLVVRIRAVWLVCDLCCWCLSCPSLLLCVCLPECSLTRPDPVTCCVDSLHVLWCMLYDNTYALQCDSRRKPWCLWNCLFSFVFCTTVPYSLWYYIVLCLQLEKLTNRKFTYFLERK